MKLLTQSILRYCDLQHFKNFKKYNFGNTITR